MKNMQTGNRITSDQKLARGSASAKRPAKRSVSNSGRPKREPDRNGSKQPVKELKVFEFAELKTNCERPSRNQELLKTGKVMKGNIPSARTVEKPNMRDAIKPPPLPLPSSEEKVPQLPGALVFSPRNYLLTMGAQKGKKKLFRCMNVSPKGCYYCHQKHSLRGVIQNNLKAKYMATKEAYCIKIINDVIFNENTHLVSVFKDYLIYDDTSEFLRKYYQGKDSLNQISVLCKFYHSYSKVFPNYILLEESKYMYKNIRRKQKAIDKLQDELNEDSYEKLQSSNRLLNTNFRNEINTLTLSKIVEKPELNNNHVLHKVNFETLMQSYIKAQPSELTESVEAGTVKDMHLTELLEKFMRKDAGTIFLKPKTVKKRREKENQIRVNRNTKENNIEVLVGAKKVVLENSPLWEQIKEGVTKYKRSKSTERPRTSTEKPVPKKRAASNPRGRPTKPKEVVITNTDSVKKVVTAPASKGLRIEPENKELDIFKTNKQILDVINRHQCSSTGVLKMNLMQSSTKRKKQRLQQGGNEFIRINPKQNSVHATPTPSVGKAALLTGEQRNLKVDKKIITNIIHEGTLQGSQGKLSIAPSSKPILKIDVHLKDTNNVPRISNFLNVPSTQRSARNPSLSETKRLHIRPTPKHIRSISTARGTKRMFTGSVATTSSTKCCSNSATRLPGKTFPVKAEGKKKALAIDIDELYKNLKKQNVEVSTERAKQKTMNYYGRSATPDCSKKYHSEYLNSLREKMESRRRDIFVLAAKGEPKRTVFLTNSKEAKVGGGKLGNLFSKEQLYTHI